MLGGPGVERRPGSSGEGKTVAAAVQGGGNTAADFFHRIGNDMAQVDPKQVETHLRRSVPILQHDEHIELAFAVGRDVTVLTTKRMLMIDVKGWSGKRVAYLSLPYTAMRAFALRSAGGRFDVDAEVDIWTNIPALNQVHQVSCMNCVVYAIYMKGTCTRLTYIIIRKQIIKHIKHKK